MPVAEDGIDGCDALPDPAHDRNRHRVAECFVAGTIGCKPAAVFDQRVVIGESLQPLALARRQAADGHLRSQQVRRTTARIGAIDLLAIGRGERRRDGLMLKHGGRRAVLVLPGARVRMLPATSVGEAVLAVPSLP